MAYVSYLHMEKAHRPSTKPDLKKHLTKECGVQVSIEDLNQVEEEIYEDSISITAERVIPFEDEFEESISRPNTPTQRDESEESISRPNTPTQEDPFDDAASLASSVPSVYERRELKDASKQILTNTSETIIEANPEMQQFLTDPITTKSTDTRVLPNRHQHSYRRSDFKSISTVSENQPLLPSTTVDHKNEPPTSPSESDEKSTSKATTYENRLYSSLNNLSND
jgi:hypothetical protein